MHMRTRVLQVGKAWLTCARMYQNACDIGRGPHAAQQALEAMQRAQRILRACSESCGTHIQCEDAFAYLIQRAQGSAHASVS